MPIKSDKESKTKLSNNVYIAAEARATLEELITDIGYQQRKVMSASSFVRFLVENYGEAAKKKILKNG